MTDRISEALLEAFVARKREDFYYYDFGEVLSHIYMANKEKIFLCFYLNLSAYCFWYFS